MSNFVDIFLIRKMKRCFHLNFCFIAWLLIVSIIWPVGCFFRQDDPQPPPPEVNIMEEIKKIWDRYLFSSAKIWVDYGEDLDTRSRINFQQGTVQIETVVALETPDIDKTGETKIAQQAEKIFSSDNPSKTELLKAQVKNQKGETVTKENIKAFIKEEIVRKIHKASKFYKSKDGVRRIKMKARINLVPDHVRVRAESYVPYVKKEAQRFKIKPHLLMAIIHTESFFNPVARSHSGALGLMQLIPEHGANDAYKFLFKKDIVVPKDVLYNPRKNIELGAAYVHLLRNKYFGDVEDRSKNLYLTICAYNWGPTNMLKRIVDRYDIQKMNDAQLFSLLQKQTPDETKKYMKKVLNRMKLYERIFASGDTRLWLAFVPDLFEINEIRDPLPTFLLTDSMNHVRGSAIQADHEGQNLR